MLRTILFACSLAVAGAPPVTREAYDLRPRFESNQSLEVALEGALSFTLDDLSVAMNGLDVVPDVPAFDVDVDLSLRLRETVLEAEEGAIARLRRTYLEDSMEATGETSMGSESEDLSESEEGVLVGRTLELTVDEDGEVSVEDVSAGDLEPLSDEDLAGLDVESHGEDLLPDEPVEVGDTWELFDGELREQMLATFLEGVAEGAAEEGLEAFDIEGLMKSLVERLHWEAAGELVAVDEDQARITWTIEVTLEVDDVFALIAEYSDPDLADQLPDSADSNLRMDLAIEGEGVFDLRQQQLTRSAFECELAVSVDLQMDEDGTAVEASLEMSGSADGTTTLELLE